MSPRDYEIEDRERRLLVAGALRFDGYAYLDACLDADPDARAVLRAAPRVPDDVLLRFAVLFFLQRACMHQPGTTLPHEDDFQRMRELWLAFVDEPTPESYIGRWQDEWLALTSEREAARDFMQERLALFRRARP